MKASNYIKGMNRRRFIQSLAAVFSLPALPSISLGTASAAMPSAVAVPAHARSWAIYMSRLHGECPPHALQTIVNVSASDAKKYVSQLIAEGAIKPGPILQKPVSEITKTNEDSLLGKFKKRLEMKAQAESEDVDIDEKPDSAEFCDGDVELPDACKQIMVKDNIVKMEKDPKHTMTQ